jgi:maltoporin
MQRIVQALGLSGLLVTGFLSAHAFAEEPTDADARHNTEEPKEAEPAAPVLAPSTAAVAPAAPVAAPAASVAAPAAKPKFGDVSTSGYFRGSFGASNHKGRMTCFQLAIPGGLLSKYRLGNECEVWGELHLTTVVYADEADVNGTVARLHFMPTVFLPTTYIGYYPTAVINSPNPYTTSTGATLSFPNLYADIEGISWLFGGTAWMGTRYYKRESVQISDFFYWNPSGVGAGIEDINLGKDLRLSYAVFAVDGEPAPVDTAPTSPSLPMRVDFGVRNDLQLRGIRPYESGEFQIGFQYIANYSNDPATHGGWGVTVQWVQKGLGGQNKLAVQYGRGGGTGFGTLSARFYTPDFSLRHDLGESRIRVVDVFTIQPTDWLGTQVAGVFQRDDLGNSGQKTDWYSAGTRVSYAFTKHAKLLGEVGYDRVKKDNGSVAQYLAKFTGALAIAAGKEFLARPELRLFYTWAMWNEAARTATVDSGMLYTTTNFLSGAIFGVQAETWW